MTTTEDLKAEIRGIRELVRSAKVDLLHVRHALALVLEEIGAPIPESSDPGPEHPEVTRMRKQMRREKLKVVK